MDSLLYELIAMTVKVCQNEEGILFRLCITDAEFLPPRSSPRSSRAAELPLCHGAEERWLCEPGRWWDPCPPPWLQQASLPWTARPAWPGSCGGAALVVVLGQTAAGARLCAPLLCCSHDTSRVER